MLAALAIVALGAAAAWWFFLRPPAVEFPERHSALLELTLIAPEGTLDSAVPVTLTAKLYSPRVRNILADNLGEPLPALKDKPWPGTLRVFDGTREIEFEHLSATDADLSAGGAALATISIAPGLLRDGAHDLQAEWDGRIRSSTRRIRVAVDAVPASERARLRARHALRIQRPADALEYVKTDSSSTGLGIRAQALEALGRHQEARAAYQQAIAAHRGPEPPIFYWSRLSALEES